MDIGRLEDRLASVLRAEALLASQDLRVSWHVESVTSLHYALVVMLVFVDPTAPEDELVVISIELNTGPDASWVVDVAGPDGLIVAEWARPDAVDKVDMVGDPDLAARLVGSFLSGVRPTIRDLLISSTG